MLKTFTLFSYLFLFISCSKTNETNENSTSSSYNEKNKVIPVEYDSFVENSVSKIDSSEVISSVDKCFKSDNDVLEFFNGKTFSRDTGNFEDYWTFYSDKVIRTCWQKRISMEKYKGDHNDEPKYQYWDYREITYNYVSYSSSLDGTEGIVEYSNTPNDDKPFSEKINCQKNYLKTGYQLGVLGEYPGDGIH